MKFIKKFKSKNIGINYDTGNSSSLGYNFESEKIYSKFIKNIHIKDRLLFGKTVRLGNGNAKIKKILQFFKKKDIEEILYFKLHDVKTIITFQN